MGLRWRNDGARVLLLLVGGGVRGVVVVVVGVGVVGDFGFGEESCEQGWKTDLPFFLFFSWPWCFKGG